MLGFKRLRNAATTISGIELMHRIRKGQFDFCALAPEDTTAPFVWNECGPAKAIRYPYL
jgi:hypothetical protein